MRRLGSALALLPLLPLAACGSASPGGDAGKDVLQKHHWLDDKDRVTYAEHAGGQDVQEAICSYLFGTPDEVGKTAQLKGSVELADDSGYRSAGGGGIGFACAYSTGKDPVFAIQLWSKDNGSSGDATHVVKVSLHDGLHGATAYAPDYDGTAMGTDAAKAWLEDAGSRAQGNAG